MADKVTRLRKGATATSQKAQKKEGEIKTSSFGDDVSAELAILLLGASLNFILHKNCVTFL
jgi:hypothetical protein